MRDVDNILNVEQRCADNVTDQNYEFQLCLILLYLCQYGHVNSYLVCCKQIQLQFNGEHFLVVP